ncbi:MAG: phage recombination protein Bet [Oligoflexia bacterium]|nr:phage recombination protein Bet [Oligoflexia bacterium]
MSIVENHHALQERQIYFPALDAEKIKLLKTQIMPPHSSDDELALFMHVIRRTKLDPFSRQIYAIRRNGDKVSFEISIDGARLIAERTGLYKGQNGPFWCDDDGIWIDVWLKNKPPVAAKIGVIRSDFSEPLFATALYREYRPNGKQGFMWDKFPTLMTAKVAEMLALRRAFPCELSGIYSQEEMAQATPGVTKKIISNSDVTLADQIIGQLRSMTSNFSDKDRLDWILEMHNIPSSRDLMSGKINNEEQERILEKLRNQEYEESICG